MANLTSYFQSQHHLPSRTLALSHPSPLRNFIPLWHCPLCFKMATMPPHMADRPGLRSLREQADNAGLADVRDEKLECRAILATLLRIKRKDRVPPSRNTEGLLFDKAVEARFPKDLGFEIDRDRPPAKPYRCELDFETCFTQYFPVRIYLTNAEALAGVKALSTAIHDDLTFLRRMLGTHADAILTRWRKKSKDKRTQLLSGLAPERKHNKPLPPDGYGTSLYDYRWAAIHLINFRSTDNSKIRTLSKWADDPQMQLIDRMMLDIRGNYCNEDCSTRRLGCCRISRSKLCPRILCSS